MSEHTTPTADASHGRAAMTDENRTQLRVECTECEFATTVARSEEGWAADAVADHAERTGHALRSFPPDE